uniref:CUB domain-containing protein n=1 Tax=Parascaris equorum TaxID=6256 RepID=A0A914RF64_PAREQ
MTPQSSAPLNGKIAVQVDSLSFPKQKPCGSTFLEIRYMSDISTTGARFCGTKAKKIVSGTNKVIILYRGSHSTSFSIRYRYGQFIRNNM